MNRQRTEALVPWVLKLGVGALLAWAGFAKIGDPAAFAVEIGNYRLLPELAPMGAAALPSLEILLGAALIGLPLRSRWLPAAALVSAGLMLLFSVAVATVLARGIDIDCGCFGSGTGPITRWTLARNLALLAVSGLLVWGTARGGPRRSDAVRGGGETG